MIRIFGRLEGVITRNAGAGSFQVDFNTTSGAIVLSSKYVFSDPVQNVHTSVLTGRRHVDHRGSHARFEVTVVSTGVGLFDAHLAFMLTNLSPGTECIFQPNADSWQQFTCLVLEVEPFCLNDEFHHDAYKITLISRDFVTINTADILEPGEHAICDHTGDALVAHDGDPIVAETGDIEG